MTAPNYMDRIRFFLSKDRNVFILFSLFTAVVIGWLYYPALRYGFRGEDFQVLYQVKNNFSFYNSFIAQFLGQFQATNFFYRPVPREFSYFIITSLFGVSSTAFRIVIFTLFLTNCFLLYALTKTITGRRHIAFVSVAFFLSRFSHFDLVFWILNGFENLILVFFVLATILAYIRFMRTSRKRYMWICSILTLFALMTKESAFMIPFYIMITQVFLGKISFRQLLYRVTPFVVLTLIFITRITIIGKNMGGGVYKLDFSPHTLFKNVIWYTTNLFNNSFELLICAVIFSIALFLSRKNKAILFGGIWFAVSLIPFIAFQRTMATYLMLPSIGMAIIVAESIHILLQKTSFNKLLCVMLASFLFMPGAYQKIRSRNLAYGESEKFISNSLQYLAREFPSFPDNTLIYIKDKGLPYWKYWLLGAGKAFMLHYDNISVYFDFTEKEIIDHYSYVYYFTTSGDSIKFIKKTRAENFK